MRILKNKKIERRIRKILCYLNPSAFRVRQKLRKEYPYHPNQRNTSLICLHITKYQVEGKHGRRFNQIYRMWERSGCHVVVIDYLPFVSNFHKKKFKNALLQERISFISSYEEIPKPYIMMADYPCKFLPPHCIKWITLEYDLPFDRQKHLALPFGMEPFLYQLQQDQALDALRTIPKEFSVLFAGSSHACSYDKPVIEKLYKKMTRRKALDWIKSNFDQKHIHLGIPPVEDQQFISKFILVDGSQSNERIPKSYWLSTVARADFFLCLPGTDYPMCHHAVEAMACGTIPILQYPELFEPPLVPGMNCLHFSNQEELLTILKLAIGMFPEDIEVIRKNVLHYYHEHLHFPKFGNSLLQHDCSQITLHIAKHVHPYTSEQP